MPTKFKVLKGPKAVAPPPAEAGSGSIPASGSARSVLEDWIAFTQTQLDEVKEGIEKGGEVGLYFASIKIEVVLGAATNLRKEIRATLDQKEAGATPSTLAFHGPLPFLPTRDDVSLNAALRAEAEARTDAMTHADDLSLKMGWRTGFVVGVRALQKAIDGQRNNQPEQRL